MRFSISIPQLDFGDSDGFGTPALQAYLRRHGLKVEFEDATARHTVMTRGIDSTEQCAHVVGAGDTRQQGEHGFETTGGADPAGLPLSGAVFHLDPPVGLR